MAEKVSAAVICGAGSRVVKGNGVLVESGNGTHPVLIREINWDDESPKFVETAAKDLLTPAFDHIIVIHVAPTAILVEPLGCKRPEGTSEAPGGGIRVSVFHCVPSWWSRMLRYVSMASLFSHWPGRRVRKESWCSRMLPVVRLPLSYWVG